MDDEQNFQIRRSQPEMLPQLYEMLLRKQYYQVPLFSKTLRFSARAFLGV